MPGRAFYWNLPAAPESEIVEKDLRAGSTLEQHRTVAETWGPRPKYAGRMHYGTGLPSPHHRRPVGRAHRFRTTMIFSWPKSHRCSNRPAQDIVSHSGQDTSKTRIITATNQPGGNTPPQRQPGPDRTAANGPRNHCQSEEPITNRRS